ncbi:hypothetical protein Apa02nite_093910 [Actinoplanes palleronii]|uniref:DUF1707 domain-containing protein n=1 Tax=Actinoplanes palleronii TaxID=113570 RepID=A0ABQ4BRI0_9ACTN|nr:hypothetical protein Apa02nite_093910 [Actinoplanes palleronii]
MPAPISDGDRERVAELLQRACGDGRITLEEFSVRVGSVWSAETDVDLTGTNAFSSHELKLAPVPRLAGTPEVRVHVNAWFSSVRVVSRRPELLAE